MFDYFRDIYAKYVSVIPSEIAQSIIITILEFLIFIVSMKYIINILQIEKEAALEEVYKVNFQKDFIYIRPIIEVHAQLQNDDIWDEIDEIGEILGYFQLANFLYLVEKNDDYDILFDDGLIGEAWSYDWRKNINFYEDDLHSHYMEIDDLHLETELKNFYDGSLSINEYIEYNTPFELLSEDFKAEKPIDIDLYVNCPNRIIDFLEKSYGSEVIEAIGSALAWSYRKGPRSEYNRFAEFLKMRAQEFNVTEIEYIIAYFWMLRPNYEIFKSEIHCVDSKFKNETRKGFFILFVFFISSLIYQFTA